MENIKQNGGLKRIVLYATVKEAINILRQHGYTTDFNLAGNVIKSDAAGLFIERLEIMDILRYEGTSDPAEEATVTRSFRLQG